MSYRLYEALKNGTTAAKLEELWKSELTAAVKRIEYEEQIEKNFLKYKETKEKAIKAMSEYMKNILNIVGTKNIPEDRLVKMAEKFFDDFENDFSLRLYNTTASKIMESNTKEKEIKTTAVEGKKFLDDDSVLKAFVRTFNN